MLDLTTPSFLPLPAGGGGGALPRAAAGAGPATRLGSLPGAVRPGGGQGRSCGCLQLACSRPAGCPGHVAAACAASPLRASLGHQPLMHVPIADALLDVWPPAAQHLKGGGACRGAATAGPLPPRAPFPAVAGSTRRLLGARGRRGSCAAAAVGSSDSRHARCADRRLQRAAAPAAGGGARGCSARGGQGRRQGGAGGTLLVPSSAC